MLWVDDMQEALNIIFQIYSKFITLVFDTLELFPNVSIGWIAVVCVVFSILFRNILALPNKGSSVRIRSKKDE